MSSKMLKRPSSARRHISYETFNPFVSGMRLRRIQSLLKGDNAGDGPDSILCITGIDSRYNEGCQHLMNYLLFDFFTRRKKELEQSGFEEEDLDDIILVIKREGVDVYCNVINYHYLLPYTSHWLNIKYHCLTETEAEDEELEEDFKILSFVSMVKNLKVVGIPYFSPGHSGRFDKFAVEKWPIIQAFGLDEIGGGGFFTMNYEVCDVSSKLEAIYSLVDPVFLEDLLSQNLKLLTRQWEDMETRFSLEIQEKMEKLGEDITAEPLLNYFKHGRVIALDSHTDLVRCPFVLYGCHSSQVDIEKNCRQLVEKYQNIASSGINNKLPHHMVCQAVSPNSSLSCTRTYFFTPVVSPFTPEEKNKQGDLWHLTSLYKMMIEALLSAVECYAKTLSLKQATSVVLYVLEESLRQLDNSVINNYFHSNRSKIVFEIAGVDNFGRRHKLEEGINKPLIKNATLSLFDLPSLEHDGKSVGSLVFSECFLDSNITIKGSPKKSHDVVIITSNIARHRSWTVRKEDLENCHSLTDEFDKLEKYGEKLISREVIHYTTGTPEYSQIYTGEMTVYENGIIIHHKEYGCILFTHTDVQHIQLYDGDTNNCVWLLMLTLDKTGVSKLPLHLIEDRRQLVLIFPPKTKTHKLLFSQILPKWKTESSFPVVERCEKVPVHLADLHDRLETQYVTSSSVKVSNLQKSATHIHQLNKFVDHLSVSTAGCQQVEESNLPYLLTSEVKATEEQLNTDHEQIIISIISGVVGSHQDKLVATITGYNEDKYRWLIIKPDNGDIRRFDGKILQKDLSAALNIHQKQEPDNRRTTRILLVKNSFTDIAEVIQAIQTHPDSDVNKSLKIGAVTICVDPLNFYLEHRVAFPGLLSECGDGWVNNILLTSSTKGQNDLMMEVQNLLRGINSNVAFIPAEKGEVHRSSDFDNILSGKEFTLPSMVRARYLSRPNWMELKPSNQRKSDLTQEVFKFTQSLDKPTFINKLKSLSSSLQPLPGQNNIYHVQGRMKFIGQEDVYEVEYVTLSGYLKIRLVEEPDTSVVHISSSSSSSPSYLLFTGSNLQQQFLKDWMRSCAAQKPEKKKLLTRNELSKDEINKIHKSQHLGALPSGWFYNGSQYISLDGDKTYTHPNLEGFIEEHLKLKNTEIQEHNKQVEVTRFVDLFD